MHKGKIEQILLAYGLPKEITAIMMRYFDTKAMVRSPDGDTGVLQGDTLTSYLFIICLDYVTRTPIDLLKENGFILKKTKSIRYPSETITDVDYSDYQALLKPNPYCIALNKQLEALISTRTQIKHIFCVLNKKESSPQASEISWLVYLPRQQYLINWKWCHRLLLTGYRSYGNPISLIK